MLADRKQIDSLKHSKKRNTRVQSKIPKQKKQLNKTSKFNPKRNYTRNIFELYEVNGTIIKLQLIKSTNNHLKKDHVIKDVVVNIPYVSKVNKLYNLLNVSVHYCKECNLYFDFYESGQQS